MSAITYGFDRTTVLKLKRDHMRLKNMVENIATLMGRNAPDTPWFHKRIPVVNESGESIPPFGVMRVTGVELEQELPRVTVDKPGTEFDSLYLFNGPREIEFGDNDKYGFAQPLSQYQKAALDDEGSVGEGWGVKPDSWLLSLGYPGTVIAGSYEDVGTETDHLAVVEWRCVETLLCKATAALTIGTHSTNYQILAGEPGSETDTGFTSLPTIHCGVEIGDDKIFYCIWVNNCWLALPWECNE